MEDIEVGTATIGPKRTIVAGSYVTLRYVYTAAHPVDDSGCVKICFRFAGDFGVPQFIDPKAPNYCAISTTGDCRIEPRWDPKGNTRPWGRSIYLKVMGGYLDRGEKIIVVFGDTSGGSPGWRVQTFCEDTFEFRTLVDPIATFRFKETDHSPTIRIVPGKATRALVIAPSLVVAGEPFDYHLKLEDAFGNPTARPRRLRHRGNETPGVTTVAARDAKTGLAAVSNPIEVVESAPALRPYWADFHAQSEETVGTNSIDDFFTFLRDSALMDIGGHQGNDFQVTDAFWRKINATTRRFNRRGAFVAFPGYEWSGNTPLGGDRNVYFRKEGGQITHSCRDLLPEDTAAPPDSRTAAELFRNLDGPDPFVFAHVGGRYADMAMHDDAIEIAVEIHSSWGTFEWLVEDALERGYRGGVCANSDDHKGRPGASYPGARHFGSFGGYTCVLAERLDRDAVHAALRARRFYATTGCRSLLDVRLNTADGRSFLMGEVVEGVEPPLKLCVRYAGTAPVEAVDVRNGLETVRTVRPYGKADLGRRVKVVWSGAEVKGRARMACWDGGLRVRGNRIESFEPVNFWNPLSPVRQVRANRLEWQSVTTGGVSGVILTLAKPTAGTIELTTAQRNVRVPVARLGLRPRTWPCGGLRKQIQAYRLPDAREAEPVDIDVPIRDLRPGDNPLYVRVTQEDGHMAWSSPIYVAR